MYDQDIRKTVLIFTAHPDDHICGAGTFMLLADRGFAIREIVATSGEKGVWLDENGKQKPNVVPGLLARKRRGELTRAQELIGIQNTTCLGLPDSELMRNYALIERFIAIIRAERPAVVFTMNPNDEHHDHRAIAAIVTEATDRAAWTAWPELGPSIRVPIFLYMEGIRFGMPHLSVDITPYLKRKRTAVAVYTSQVDAAERRHLEAMNTYHAFFHRQPSTTAAENFEIPSEFPMNLNALIELFGPHAAAGGGH